MDRKVMTALYHRICIFLFYLTSSMLAPLAESGEHSFKHWILGGYFEDDDRHVCTYITFSFWLNEPLHLGASSRVMNEYPLIIRVLRNTLKFPHPSFIGYFFSSVIWTR